MPRSIQRDPYENLTNKQREKFDERAEYIAFMLGQTVDDARTALKAKICDLMQDKFLPKKRPLERISDAADRIIGEAADGLISRAADKLALDIPDCTRSEVKFLLTVSIPWMENRETPKPLAELIEQTANDVKNNRNVPEPPDQKRHEKDPIQAQRSSGGKRIIRKGNSFS